MRFKTYIIGLFVIVMSALSISCENKHADTRKVFQKSFITHVSEDNLPIIKFDVKGKKTLFIVDTGSDINVINQKIYDTRTGDFEITDSVMLTVNTISGKYNKNTYIVGVNLDDSIYTNFYVMDISSIIYDTYVKQHIIVDGIVGVNFLHKNGVIVNFKNKTFYNNG